MVAILHLHGLLNFLIKLRLLPLLECVVNVHGPIPLVNDLVPYLHAHSPVENQVELVRVISVFYHSLAFLERFISETHGQFSKLQIRKQFLIPKEVYVLKNAHNIIKILLAALRWQLLQDSSQSVFPEEHGHILPNLAPDPVLLLLRCAVHYAHYPPLSVRICLHFGWA